MLVYGSVCSGVGAATVAWRPLGWRAAWFAEILPFPSAVLAHHYRETPNLGDVTKIYEKKTLQKSKIDLLVGGTPCQSFSMAGLRKGLEDPRGNLMLEFLRLAHIKRPRWLVWENVPGVLSSNGGRDFGSFLGALRYLGYCGAWRVLDAQYFGVPQKRRRIFMVGYRGGDWRPPAEVLFESGSLPRSPEPNKEIQQESPEAAFERPSSGSEPLIFNWQEGRVFKCSAVSNPLTASQTQAAVVFEQAHFGGNNQTGPEGRGRVASTIKAGYFKCWNDIANVTNLCPSGRYVRRLTPLECERLQGFPDNYTKIRGASDADRYRAVGNSMAIPVCRWLGKRIKARMDAEISEER